MPKKDEDAKRRKALKKQKADRRGRERSVKFQQDGKAMVIRQGGNTYDVEMIRDFFDHLMLELKNRHDEASVLVEALEAGDKWQSAYAKSKSIESPVDDELYRKYLKKYPCALLLTNSIETNGASEKEIAMFLKAHRTEQIETSAKMMACLKALESQLDESLMCAKMPFGELGEGAMATPTNQIRVMDHIDAIRKALQEDGDGRDDE